MIQNELRARSAFDIDVALIIENLIGKKSKNRNEITKKRYWINRETICHMVHTTKIQSPIEIEQ